MKILKKHPTKEQIQIVIDTLSAALPYAEKIRKTNWFYKKDINMNKCSIDKECGTPMCHGGWYAAISSITRKARPLNYESGAFLMAKDLGFPSKRSLQNWAKLNPIIWGNDFGELMFCSEFAFDNCSEQNISLLRIIEHWKGVKKRLQK